MNWKRIYAILFGGVRKNLHLPYFLHGFGMLLTPRWLTQFRRKSILRSFHQLTVEEQAAVQQRVNYYCRLDSTCLLPAGAPSLGDQHFFHRHEPSVYFFDTYEWNRFFPSHLHWLHDAGDVNYLESAPTIVKSRPITPNNENAYSVLINQDKVRHFMFFRDPIPLKEKKNQVIFRGAVKRKKIREEFVRLYHDNPLFDIYDSSGYSSQDPTEIRKQTPIYDHLQFKFIMCLEGNDVASNLKWVMNSNSLAVSPRPTCETWFMEGLLIPNYHYIEILPDFSDLELRIAYYIDHPEEAQAIVDHAHEFCSQFFNKQRERLVSLMVMEKYFRQTGQEL